MNQGADKTQPATFLALIFHANEGRQIMYLRFGNSTKTTCLKRHVHGGVRSFSGGGPETEWFTHRADVDYQAAWNCLVQLSP